ncbi:MAG: glycoside hydrolase family 5 protein [Treponema sp.]|nr:glycoside hydrolase family 5 protein [Treponema sp.]
MAVKRVLFASFAIVSLLLTACGSSSAKPFVPSVPDAVRDNPLESVSGKTAFDYFKDENILSGWNLGNTLDSYNDGFAGETLWGNPSINQELMNGIKAAGYDLIRIPITWMGHIGSAPDHRISTRRLERVADVAEMANKAGLKVIINIHHDGSTPNEGIEHGWLSIRKSYRNDDEYKKITHKFTRMWDQIAAYFQNYGDWLIFESFNELHDGGWGWGLDFRMFPQQQLDIINNWNQIFTDRVRASGGNNDVRYLVIPAYCTIAQQTLSDAFILPADITPSKQIVSFHYYDPYEFGIEGKTSLWGSEEDRKKTDDDFAPFKPHFVDRNIPVIIGECGAVLQLYPNDSAREAQARQSRYNYILHVFTTAKKYGLVPVYWDNGLTRGNGEKFGLFDRRTGLPNSPDSEALIRMMINAVR